MLSQSGQEVPEWLEEIAMGAVGSSYGPGGGQFLSRDRRVRLKTFCIISILFILATNCSL